MNECVSHDPPLLWYLRRQGEVRGPYHGGVIRRFAVLGRVTLADEVSSDRENWRPIAEVPQVLPPAIRDALARGDETALQPLRRHEDERSGTERRTAADDAKFEDRRRGERRGAELPVQRSHRLARTALLRLGRERSLPRGRLVAAALILIGIVALGFHYGDDAVVGGPDCRAAPAAGVDWRNCRLEGLQAARLELSRANMNNSVLRGADLSGARLNHGDLRYADLGGANLSYAQLDAALLKGANLQQADLAYASLGGADLSFADLRGSNLGGAALDGARLDEALWYDGTRCLPGSVGECRRAPAAE